MQKQSRSEQVVLTCIKSPMCLLIFAGILGVPQYFSYQEHELAHSHFQSIEKKLEALDVRLTDQEARANALVEKLETEKGGELFRDFFGLGDGKK